MSVPTPTELRATLVRVVAGATETRVQKWKELIGDVEMLPIAFHPAATGGSRLKRTTMIGA